MNFIFENAKIIFFFVIPVILFSIGYFSVPEDSASYGAIAPARFVIGYLVITVPIALLLKAIENWYKDMTQAYRERMRDEALAMRDKEEEKSSVDKTSA